MHIHCLQHVPFEGLGAMAELFARRGDRVSTSHLYRADPLPALDTFDWLVVMGGPMGADDEADYPWLGAEKALIRRAIGNGKRVLGICLGAQLMARALGAVVRPGAQREIGWFPITPTDESDPHWGQLLRHSPTVFHWHSDRFDLPDGATHLARSGACDQQAFALGPRVLGLQFHLETTPELARALSHHCANELNGGEWVQTPAQIARTDAPYEDLNRLMGEVIDIMAGAP